MAASAGFKDVTGDEFGHNGVASLIPVQIAAEVEALQGGVWLQEEIEINRSETGFSTEPHHIIDEVWLFRDGREVLEVFRIQPFSRRSDHHRDLETGFPA
jgi:hypothetical protein